MGHGATIIYRGPLERSRLRCIVAAAAAAYGASQLFWLLPRASVPRSAIIAALNGFLRDCPGVDSASVLDGAVSALPATIERLRAGIADRRAPVVSVGFTALPYGQAVARGPLTWSVNGIPEERLLHRSSVVDRLYVRAVWRTARLGKRPDVVVTVSHRMSQVIRDRFGAELVCVAVPNCVENETFRAPGHPSRSYLTYLGTGAPWQNLDALAELWWRLSLRRPELRFRVISRDPRCRALVDAVPPGSVELHQADTARQVASLLWEARLGFMLRARHVVNEVAFPTKFGEYVAAGVPVVTTGIGWDVDDIATSTGAALLLDPDAACGEATTATEAFLDEVAADAADRCSAAAALLDQDLWVGRLADWFPAGGG